MKNVFLLLSFLFSLAAGAQNNHGSAGSPFKAYIYIIMCMTYT